MAELKFLITGDDSQLRKTLEKSKKDSIAAGKSAMDATIKASEAGDKKLKDLMKSLQVEITKTTDTTVTGSKKQDSAIKNQVKSTDDLLKKYSDLAKKSREIHDAKKPGGSTESSSSKVDGLKEEIEKIAKAGAEGTSTVGEAMNEVADTATESLTGLIDNLLPGVGLGVIAGFAIRPIVAFIKELEIFNQKIGDSIRNLALMNQVNKEANEAAGEEAATLKILYKAATDINETIETRTKAVKELQKLFPENFSASRTQAILNGEEAESYRLATAEILANSKAKAAKTKIDAIEAQLLDSEFEKDKIRIASANQRNRAKDKVVSTGGGGTTGVGTSMTISKEIQKKNITAREKEQIAEKEENEKVLKNQRDFLTKYVGLKNLTNAVIGEPDKIKAVKDFTKTDAAEFKAQEELQKRIEDIKDKFANKELDKDEQRRAALIQEFKDLAHDIEQQGLKYDAYAKRFGAEKAKNVLGEKKSVSVLEPIKEAAIANLNYEIDTEKLKIKLEKEKQLYTDYEKFKTDFGKEAADKRFGVEVDYMKTLKAEKEKLSGRELNGSEKERLKEVELRLDAEVNAEAKKSETLLAEFMTYATKRQVTIESYLAKEAALRKDGHDAEADQAKEAGIKAVADIDDLNSKELGEFEKLLNGIDKLSTKEARKSIAAAKTLLAQKVKDGKISVECAKEIGDLLDNTTDTITNRLPDGLINVANAMDKIAGAVGDMDSGFANVLKLAASVTGELGNAFRSADAFSKAKTTGDKLSAGMGMVGAGLAIVQTMNNFLDRETKADKERANSKAKELRSTEALTKALERQLSVADKAYGTKKIDEYRKAIDDANKAIADGTKSLSGRKALTGDKEIDDLIAKVNNGEKLKGWKLWGESEQDIYDAWKKQLKGISTDVKELQRLLDNGMLDANTAKIAQNFINAKDAIDQANNSMAEFVTATSFTSIADSIVDLFATGNAAAEDFGNNFEDIMKKAILNSFKTQSLATQLQGFYNNFAKFADSNGQLTEVEIAKLRAEYDKIISESAQKFSELEKVTGMSFAPKPEDAGGSGLKGAIKRELTEQTASELTGLYRATYDLQKNQSNTLLEQRNLMSQKLAVLNVIAANTGATAANTNRLEAIETSLATIVTNTKPGQTARALGI